MKTVVPNAQELCHFWSRICSNDAKAVVWTADGRGACGAHHNDLARMKTVEL